MITLQLCINGNEAGKSFWRFNDFLLSEEEYVDQIKACINNTINENNAVDISKHTLFQSYVW